MRNKEGEFQGVLKNVPRVMQLVDNRAGSFSLNSFCPGKLPLMKTVSPWLSGEVLLGKCQALFSHASPVSLHEVWFDAVRSSAHSPNHQYNLLLLHNNFDFLKPWSLFLKNLELKYSWIWQEVPQLSITCIMVHMSTKLEHTTGGSWSNQDLKTRNGADTSGPKQQRQISSNLQFH